MNASILKRTLVIAAVVAVPWIGCSLWSASRERAEKEALAAEIRAEMAARRGALQDGEPGIADLTETYRTALAAAGDTTVSQAIHNLLFRTERWPTVPPEVAALLQTRGPGLDAFAAAVAPLPPGRMTLTEQEWVRFGGIVTLLRVRGRAQVTTGDLGGLLGTVRLLRRAAVEVDASTRAESSAWPAKFPEGIERAALDLLARLAVHPALGEKEATEGLAIAGGPWAVVGASIRTHNWVVEENDRLSLDLLSDDPLERMKERGFVADSFPLAHLEEVLKGRVGPRPAGPRGPPRAGVLRRMREIAVRHRTAFESRDAEAVLLGGPLDRESQEDLGGGWTAGHLSPYPRMGRDRWDLEARLPVLRAAFALRIREIRDGRTPATLEELVPALLEAVPEDLWTGEKVRIRTRPNGWALEAGHPDVRFTFAGGWAEMRVPYYLEK